MFEQLIKNPDLKVLAQRDGSINVLYKGRNVYVGGHTWGPKHAFIIVSVDENTPVWGQGVDVDGYLRKGESLKDMLDRTVIDWMF